MAVGLVVLAISAAGGAEVSGRVELPEICSPEISPAVVTLERDEGAGPTGRVQDTAVTAQVSLIRQRGLQFVPRVQVMTMGRTLRFTNEDAETHNVHLISGRDGFNRSMAPGGSCEFIPERPGVLRLVCDVHGHMRGFVVVSASPWAQACTREGRFRFIGVPDGRYVLSVWHEVGRPIRQDVTVQGGASVVVETLTMTGPARTAGEVATTPVRPWHEVIDRIGMVLATSLKMVSRPGEARRARTLAEDAYWGEFEASDMETAVRNHLGYARAGELEGRFRAIIRDVRDVAEGRQGLAVADERKGQLLLALLRSADELNRKGVTDRDHLLSVWIAPASSAEPETRDGDPAAQLLALRRGFDGVCELADRGEVEDAASEMTTVYFNDFEPLERRLGLSKPQDIPPLERTFQAIRGEVGAGLKGDALGRRLDALRDEVDAALGRGRALAAGTFAPAFAVSLVTILREGAEVILLLGMLIGLAVKTGQGGALRAIVWGVGLAIAASLVTALGLNALVASTQARTRELVEGLVMLAAAGVLFYVSYWLISQSESKRWLDFLKRQARRGSEAGGLRTLALTAFLAVYREGAETALMYQALITGHGQARAGAVGLLAGFLAGLVLLVAIVLVIRATSLRLPLRTFFTLTGFVLFAMAVVFAGNGIFELQSSGILKITTVSWLGTGVPFLGLYPNIQVLSVQALLVAGAVLALGYAGEGVPSTLKRTGASGASIESAPKAGVGV